MPSFPLIRFPLFLALFLWCASVQVCSKSAVADAKTVANGTWGGEHVILEVSKNGGMLELDCAHGEITQPLVLDKRGSFDVTGTFTPEHGGPIRKDEHTPAEPARYSGHVEGNTMSLTIIRGQETIGTYNLTHGSHPMLRKCR